MKRIVTLVIALLMFSCEKDQSNHYKSLKLYFKGIADCDLAMVKKVSTGTTYALTKSILENKYSNDSYATYSKVAYIVSRKCNSHSKIVMIRDSIFDEGNKAVIWFRLDDSIEILRAPLVLIDDVWLVDIPLLDASLDIVTSKN